MLHQCKYRIEIDCDRAPPLLVRHCVDVGILRWPNPVVRHKDVEASEPLDGVVNEPLGCSGSLQVALDRSAFLCTAFADNLLGFGFSFL